MAIAGFYTYVHHRADDGKVFYVGKGKGARAHSYKGRNPHWWRTARKHGLLVEIAARWPTEAEAFEHEKFLIACFRDMGQPLSNMTDGGDGPCGLRHTEDAREKMSQTRKGRVTSAETKAKMSAAAKSRAPHPNSLAALRAAQNDPERIRKIGAAHKGRAIPQARRDKIAATLKGRTQPAAVREKVAAMVRSPEWRARHSAAMKGRTLTEEHKAKLRKPWSEAARAAHAKEKA